jgi:hypothetical protein
MAMRGSEANHQSELPSSLDQAASSDPDLADHWALRFVALLTLPTYPDTVPERNAQAAAIAGFR